MKKLQIILLMVAIAYGANAQKLIPKMSKDVCQCINSPENAIHKELLPEELLEKCFFISFKKHEKEITKIDEKGEKAMDDFTNELVMSIGGCGAFDYLQREGKYDLTKVKPHTDATECAGMREGVFKYVTKESEQDRDAYFERQDTFQFEYWGTEGHYIETRTIWDESCRYHTAHVKTNSEETKKYISPGQGIKAVIVKVEKDIYTLFVERPDGTQTLIQYQKVTGKPFKYIGKP